MKQVLSIQDLSCVGKCSLTVAMPVLGAMGCACTPLPTAVLSSHTGFPAPHIRPLTEDVAPICRHFQQIGVQFDVISVGYLANAAQINAVGQILKDFHALTVLDPAFGDRGQLYSGIDENHIAATRALCKKADILLPNVTEAAFLAGMDYRQTQDIGYYRQLLEKLKHFGAQGVLITGATLSENTVGFIGLDSDKEISCQVPTEKVTSHGTGDLFTAVVSGALSKGKTLLQAGTQAADFVAQVLRAAPENSPFGLPFENQLPLLWEKA